MEPVSQGSGSANGHAAAPSPQPLTLQVDEPSERAENSAPYTGLTANERHKLREEIDRVWHEAIDMQHAKGYVNPTNVGDWLVRTEKSMKDAPYPATQAMYCLLRARYSLAKAAEAGACEIWGYCAVMVELLYLATVLIGRLWLGVHAESILNERFHTVPLFVFVWGFLGGVTWCIYCAAY
jgi:hypothetical protein